MQAHVLYGSRLAALWPLLSNLGFAAAAYWIGGGVAGSVTGWIALGAVVLGLWSGRELIRPRELWLDAGGLTFKPSFGTPKGPIRWGAFEEFAIKTPSKSEGKHAKRKIVCQYRDDDGATVTLDLGSDWSLGGGSIAAAPLDDVLSFIVAYRMDHDARSGQRIAPAPQPSFSQPSRAETPRPATAATRSGIVYPKDPVETGHRGEIAKGPAIKPLGWALLLVGLMTGLGAVPLFMRACRDGLCQNDFWDVSDVRVWVFSGVWTFSLLIAAIGIGLLARGDDDRGPGF